MLSLLIRCLKQIFTEIDSLTLHYQVILICIKHVVIILRTNYPRISKLLKERLSNPCFTHKIISVIIKS